MTLSSIFSYYDKVIMGISPGYSGFLSLVILAIFIFSLYRFIKGGFIWVLLILIFVPATWPALKSLGRILILIFQFLLLRIKI